SSHKFGTVVVSRGGCLPTEYFVAARSDVPGDQTQLVPLDAILLTDCGPGIEGQLDGGSRDHVRAAVHARVTRQRLRHRAGTHVRSRASASGWLKRHAEVGTASTQAARRNLEREVCNRRHVLGPTAVPRAAT